MICFGVRKSNKVDQCTNTEIHVSYNILFDINNSVLPFFVISQLELRTQFLGSMFGETTFIITSSLRNTFEDTRKDPQFSCIYQN